MAKSFASDNSSSAHPVVMEALRKANTGHALAYGEDDYTKRALKKFKEHFGKKAEAFLVYNGTAANVLSLKQVSQSFNSVICAASAHMHLDECSAPENFSGCKLLTVPTPNGKISLESVKPFVYGFGDQHHAQPKVISITQATEVGTVYTLKEIRALSKYAHTKGMLLHMDGARLANAAASLDKSLKEVTFSAGVDILSFGGTKNGMMFGDAVVFPDQKMTENFQYVRKQGMQLASKMRFIAAQFQALLSNDLWRENATHANHMATLLAEKVSKIPNINLTQKVEANAVFATIPEKAIAILQKHYYFYIWDPPTSEVRWVCSFDTTEQDINDFGEKLKKYAR